MNSYIKQHLKQFPTKEEKTHQLREYLQLLTLQILDEKSWFKNIVFVGGTALRILYDLNRFSEDLDFSLLTKKGYSFEKITEDIQRTFKQHAITANISIKKTSTHVDNSWIKFPNLLFELGLTSHKNQKLSIKLEIDTNPPKGFHTTTTLQNNPTLFAITHYDIPSLYAGKCHAILSRAYTKGRDYYDLLWYMTRKETPNFTLLNNALLQTNIITKTETPTQLQKRLLDSINTTNYDTVYKDLSPFLINNKEKRFFNKETFNTLLSAQNWR